MSKTRAIMGAGMAGSSTVCYAPSWIDRLTERVERLPGPSWPYYLGLAGLVLLVGVIILWAEGALPPGEFHRLHLSLAVTVGYLPALLHTLDRQAGAALDKMRPILETSEDQHADLRYQLTTLPARPALLAGAVVFVVPLAIDEVRRAWGEPTLFSELGLSTASYWFIYALYRLTWWLFGTFIYHLWHQLRQINYVYTAHTRVNLFQVGPLYAFSRVTALTAIGLVIPPYVFVALIPGAHADPLVITYMLLFTGVSLGAFAWPLLGIHRLLSEEKARLLDENSLRLQAAIAKLRERADRELEQLGALSTALSTLQSERSLLDGIPTWPWQSETVRLLFTALGVPLGLWIAQYLLQRVLGP